MLNVIPILIGLHAIALAMAVILFVPASFIRWGWLWYAQILLSEWVFVPLFLGVLISLIHPSLVWFLITMFIYILQRSAVLHMSSANEKSGPQVHKISTFSILDLLKNIWPFLKTPKSIKWTLPSLSDSLTHLKFATESPRGVCLLIHGGAWKHGDAQQLSFVSALFQGLKFEVVSLNYKKFPEAHLSEIASSLEETFLGICAAYGDHQKFTLYGRSAGGHLALYLAARFPERIENAIALYPVTDFPSLYLNSDDHDLLKTRTWLTEVVGGSLDQKESLYSRLSPSEIFLSKQPRILLVHGENDPVVPVQQSDLLLERLSKRQASVAYLRFTKATHGFDAFWGGLSMLTFRSVLIEFLTKSGRFK